MVLMLFDIPLPFAPTFYKIDFSEVPVLVGAFTMGPVAGAFDRTGQNPVEPPDQRYINSWCWRPRKLPDRMCNVYSGFPDLSEVTFSQGCDHRYGNRNCFMTIVGCFINAYLLLPAYAAAFHMPIDALVAMGTAVNSHINSLLTFVLLSVAPFNLLKGFLVSLIVFLIYKKISDLQMGRE